MRKLVGHDAGDTPHSFLFPTFLRNTNQTCVTMLCLFFFFFYSSCVPKLVRTTILSQKKCQITRPSTPGVLPRWNTVIISQQKYLFPQPVFTTTTRKKPRKRQLEESESASVISTRTLGSSSTWRVRGAPQLFWGDIFHRKLFSRSTKESFRSKLGGQSAGNIIHNIILLIKTIRNNAWTHEYVKNLPSFLIWIFN